MRRGTPPSGHSRNFLPLRAVTDVLKNRETYAYLIMALMGLYCVWHWGGPAMALGGNILRAVVGDRASPVVQVFDVDWHLNRHIYERKDGDNVWANFLWPPNTLFGYLQDFSFWGFNVYIDMVLQGNILQQGMAFVAGLIAMIVIAIHLAFVCYMITGLLMAPWKIFDVCAIIRDWANAKLSNRGSNATADEVAAPLLPAASDLETDTMDLSSGDALDKTL